MMFGNLDPNQVLTITNDEELQRQHDEKLWETYLLASIKFQTAIAAAAISSGTPFETKSNFEEADTMLSEHKKRWSK